jgi:hypothetical protein
LPHGDVNVTIFSLASFGVIMDRRFGVTVAIAEGSAARFAFSLPVNRVNLSK